MNRADDPDVNMLNIPYRVTDLKQWVYCPRVLYYHTCLPHVRPVTYKMKVGKEAGKSEEGRERRRGLRVYGIQEGKRQFEVPLISERLGLRGLVDMIIWPRGVLNEVIPVDYKMARKAGPHFKLQLAAYAMMLEDALGVTVRRGFLYFIPLRKAEEVVINQRLREKLMATLETMQQMLYSERMPTPTRHRRKCMACEFRRFCNDVL